MGPGGLSADRLRSCALLDECFRRTSTRSGDSTTLDPGEGGAEYARACCEVDCASFEVERARDATNSAVALRTAPSAGDNERRKVGQEVHEVLSGIGPHPVKVW